MLATGYFNQSNSQRIYLEPGLRKNLGQRISFLSIQESQDKIFLERSSSTIKPASPDYLFSKTI